MSARFEAVALKKLQEIIQEKGISAEAIFSKFDINNDGSLDVKEFKQAITLSLIHISEPTRPY